MYAIVDRMEAPRDLRLRPTTPNISQEEVQVTGMYGTAQNPRYCTLNVIQGVQTWQNSGLCRRCHRRRRPNIDHCLDHIRFDDDDY